MTSSFQEEDRTPFSVDEQAFQALFEAAMDAMVIVDDQGCYMAANRAACELFGMAREDLLGHGMTDFGGDGWILEQACPDMQPQGSGWGELTFAGTDGDIRIVEYRRTPHISSQHHLLVLRDTRERRALEHHLQQRNQALQTSETRFLELSEALPANIYIIVRRYDGSFYFEHISRAIEVIHEVSVDQILQNANIILDCIHPDDRAGYDAAAQQSMDMLQPFAHEWRIIMPSGAIKWIQGRSLPRVRSNGDIAWYGVVLDITDRKQAELALKREIQRRQSLVNASFDGIVVVDSQGNVIEANHSFATLLGYSLEEILTLNVADWDVPITPTDLAALRQLQAPTHTCETRHRRKDGTLVDVEICCNRVEWGGEVLRFCVCRNISDRKHLEATLRQREALLESIFNGVEVAISVVDIDAENQVRFVDFNPACEQFSGLEAATFRGKDLTELAPFLSADHLANMQAYYQHCATTGETVQFEIALQVKGQEQWWLSSQTPLVNETGRVDRVVGTSIPITQRKFAETQLEIQNSLLAQIATGEPLHSILNGIVEQMEQWWQHTCCAVMLLDTDQRLRYRAHRRLPEAYVRATEGMSIGDRRGACGTAAFLKQTVIVSDIAEESSCQGMQDLVLEHGLRACWATPILSGSGQVLGIFALYYGVVRSPQPHEMKVIEQLANLARIAIEHNRAVTVLHQQAHHERAFNRVVEAIRSSLDLDTIFAISIGQIADLLQSDVSIVQYLPDLQCWRPRVIQHQDYPYAGGCTTDIADLDNPFAVQLRASQVVIVNNTNMIQDPVNHGLAESSPGAWLLVPIDTNSRVWGSLSLVRRHPTASWQTEDVDLAQRVANQLAIAIHQAELYTQVQQLNTSLEQQVQDRTADVQQALEFERLLQRITDQVRDSLDEDQILATAVQELAQGLQLECCDTGIYNAERTTSTIAYEFTRSLLPALGRTFTIENAPHAEVYASLLQGDVCQFCDVVPNSLRSNHLLMTVLACPIRDERETLGDVWLFKQPGDVFNALEVRLAQQVANQCAIALRQSRLYQAAQSQVRELERLNQLKDDFLSTVSHELRTPMANIKMATQMLEIFLNRLGVFADESNSIKRYFEVLQEEEQREIILINDLLDLARLDAETEPLDFIKIDLQTYLSHITESFIERTYQQQQRLLIQISEDVFPLTTHLPYLERILTELLHNACKYTPAGETIQLSAQITPEGIEISVSNSGVAIPQVECDRIFDKFYRIPSNDPWKHGGTGLGLALVRKMLKRLGGTIAVRSMAQPRMTTFIVHLPHLP